MNQSIDLHLRTNRTLPLSTIKAEELCVSLCSTQRKSNEIILLHCRLSVQSLCATNYNLVIVNGE